MPYKSDAQRGFMHAKHPEIAAKWDAEIRSKKHKHSKDCEHAVNKADPFEIKKVKTPKLNTGFDAAQKAGQYARRAGRGASNAAHNKISKPGWSRSQKPVTPNHQFGKPNVDQQLNRSANRWSSYVVGGAAGATAGAVASAPMAPGKKKRAKQIEANSATIRTNNKKIKSGVGKAFKAPKRPHLITEMGTKRGKLEEKEFSRLPKLRPVAFGAGVATGVGTTLGGSALDRSAQKGKLERQGKRIKSQEKKMAVAKSDPFEINKWDNQKGRKTKIAGAATGGFLGGAFASGAVGRPGLAVPAAAAGAVGAGAYTKKKLGPKKGKLNAIAKSAFGVDHGY